VCARHVSGRLEGTRLTGGVRVLAGRRGMWATGGNMVGPHIEIESERGESGRVGERGGTARAGPTASEREGGARRCAGMSRVGRKAGGAEVLGFFPFFLF
jgi:hypothetical protein